MPRQGGLHKLGGRRSFKTQWTAAPKWAQDNAPDRDIPLPLMRAMAPRRPRTEEVKGRGPSHFLTDAGAIPCAPRRHRPRAADPLSRAGSVEPWPSTQGRARGGEPEGNCADALTGRARPATRSGNRPGSQLPDAPRTVHLRWHHQEDPAQAQRVSAIFTAYPQKVGSYPAGFPQRDHHDGTKSPPLKRLFVVVVVVLRSAVLWLKQKLVVLKHHACEENGFCLQTNLNNFN